MGLLAAGLAALLLVPSVNAKPVSAKAKEPRDRYFRTPRAFPRAVPDFRNRAQACRELEAARQRMAADAASREARGIAPARAATWVSAGPTNMNGRVTSIAADSTHPSRLFAATVGGLWRSLDRGRSWERVSDSLRSGVWGAIAVTPGSDVVFAGGGDPQMLEPSSAGGPGLWFSRRAGAPGSWEDPGIWKLDGAVTVRIRIDPRAPHDVYVATDQGVFVGRPSGSAFKWGRLGGFGRRCTDLAVDFSAQPPLVYAAVYRTSRWSENGIWKYSGGTWRKVNTGIPVRQAGVIALSLSLARPSVLYAKVAQDAGDALLGIYRTDTAAEPGRGRALAWRDVTGGLRDTMKKVTWFNSVIECDPRDPDLVYVGDIELYRGRVHESADSLVAEWREISENEEKDWQGKESRIHSDQHTIVFDPADASAVIVGNDGGIDRLVLSRDGRRRWEHISHGMTIAEIHKIALQRNTPTLIAAGVQDNGTAITFGNLTWHHHRAWDGGDVGVDAANSLASYQVCDDHVDMIVNPIPGTPDPLMYGARPPTGSEPPVAAHPVLPGFALSCGPRDAAGYQTLLRRTGSREWKVVPVAPRFPSGTEISAFGLAADSSMRTFYVGYRGRLGAQSSIRATHDGGKKWISGDGLPDLSPNRIEVDHRNPMRAIAAFGGDLGANGRVMLTRDGGRYWYDVTGSGIWRLPHTAVTAAVFDPGDSDVIYAATDVGVFRGRIVPSARPVGLWAPFSEGLPRAVSVNDIAVHDGARRLVIGTMGYGAFTRELAREVPPVLLSIRDNVFDTGVGPAPTGIPDPERPANPAGDHWYEPDASPEGRLTSWSSPDIRMDVPARAPERNRVEIVDHVAFETCPLSATRCPAGAIRDRVPAAGETARLFVQVTNRGTEPAAKTRVVALWANDGPVPPPLPTDFWKKTFPSEGPAGALAAKSAWVFVDADTPMRVVSEIAPGSPQVARFNWRVPAGGARYILAIADCGASSVLDSVRAIRATRVESLAPVLPQMAVRKVRPAANTQGEK